MSKVWDGRNEKFQRPDRYSDLTPPEFVCFPFNDSGSRISAAVQNDGGDDAVAIYLCITSL